VRDAIELVLDGDVDGRVAVAVHVAPQRGDAVDVGVALGVVERRVVRALDDREVLLRPALLLGEGVPEVLAVGARGTICGLANVMPRLMRAMMDLPTAFDRREILPYLNSGDTILSRRPFIPSVKAVIAETMNDPEWRRVIPPVSEIESRISSSAWVSTST
jgi:hypothetical protein